MIYQCGILSHTIYDISKSVSLCHNIFNILFLRSLSLSISIYSKYLFVTFSVERILKRLLCLFSLRFAMNLFYISVFKYESLRHAVQQIRSNISDSKVKLR